MKIGARVSALLDAITPSKAELYLRRRGWKRIDHPNKNIRLYALEEGEHNAPPVIVPASRLVVDYAERLVDLIRALSLHERTEPEIIVNQIAYWDRDVLRFRVTPDVNTPGSIPLDEASSVVATLKDFVGYAAAVQSNPQAFFVRAPKLASEFAERCRFGHTFHGSFGLTVEFPLSLSPFPALIPDAVQPPFEREVTQRICYGSMVVESSVEKDDPDQLVRDFKQGFNANMCEKLSDLLEQVEATEINYSMSWSPEFPVSDPIRRAREFRVGAKAVAILKDAAERLHKVEEFGVMRVTGQITQLRSEVPPTEVGQEDLLDRMITMLWEYEKKQYYHIHVALARDSYRRGLRCP